MRMLAVAASLIILAAMAAGHSGSHRPPGGAPVINCDKVDYLFVLNLQRKDFAENPAGFQQLVQDFINRLVQLNEAGIGVGILTFNKQVDCRVPVSHNLTLLSHALECVKQPPKFDGIATGDALFAANEMLVYRSKRLLEDGIKDRKLLVVAAVSGNMNCGVHKTFGASIELRKVASHIFAVNIGGGASRKELYQISSDGTSGIFEVSTILDAAMKTREYAEVFCPCPFPWTRYDNCTSSGQVRVERFSYYRAQELTNNCILNTTISTEQCNCPPPRVDRTACEGGRIRVSIIIYIRVNNSNECVEQINSTTSEPCGRATGCEALVCPPGSNCVVNNVTSAISCVCVNPNDVFKVTGCESCGDRAPIISYGPCINGQREVALTNFTKINATSCMHTISRRTENCSDCPSNSTRQYGPCVRGYQQVTITYYTVDNATGRCFKELKTNQVGCRLNSEYQCVGTAISGGQFVTYDNLNVDFPGPCSYLLTERVGSFRVHVQHLIPFPSVPYLTKIQSVTIVIGNISYEISHNLVLRVSGTVQSLPYSDAAFTVEAFFSDDAVVFSYGELYVQMRGSAVTVSVSTNTNLRGIFGNCNGNLTDDYTTSTGQDVSQQTDRDSALGNSFLLTACVTTPCCPVPSIPICERNTTLTAKTIGYCGILEAEPMSPFAHCTRERMRPLLKSCVALFCRSQDNPTWQSSLICDTMEAAAFRCFLQRASTNRSSYPVFRTQNFCPKTCGHNAEFVENAEFCPKTCARHFFSSQSLGCATPFGYKSRNEIGQAPAPGCQCKPGFVLDGSNCVLPSQCKCLEGLCIDRVNRSTCESWKAKGYCNEYPLQMRYYCKLTCEQCRVPCQDQISKTSCQLAKAQGLCVDSFYHQMCKLTCNPSDCECPECITVRSNCDPIYKNRLVSRYCYAPDDTGHCKRNLTSTVYEPCGICPADTRSVENRACDYCSQVQTTRSLVYVRESTGEMRCLQVSSNATTRSAGCECTSSTNTTVCYRNSEIYIVRNVYAPSADCSSCQASSTENFLQNVTCPKTVVRGDCDTKVTNRRKVIVRYGLVSACQCNYIEEETEELCSCPKPYWTPYSCHRNHALVRWFLSFSLVKGRCVAVVTPHKMEVKCSQKPKSYYHCEGCIRLEQRVWYERRHCKCVLLQKKSRVGSCCCPPPTETRGQCIGGQRVVIVTKHVLDNHECQAIQQSKTERCGCPPSKPIHHCDSDSGVVTVGTLVYKLVDGTCEEVKMVNSKKLECKPMKVTRRGECTLLKPDDRVKYRKVYYELWERVDGTCHCRRIRRTKTIACGCREPLVRLAKCPSNCPATSESCPDHCHRTRSVIEYRFEDGRCEPEERDQEDLPCCCDKPSDKAPECENDRILKVYKYSVKLVGNACKLKEYVVRTDAARLCDLTDVRQKRNGDLIIKMHRVLHNCHCVWRQKSQHCPASCPKPKKIVRCDGATGERVVTEYHYRLQACRCFPVRKQHRVAVECPKPKVEQENQCSSESPWILVRKTDFSVDDNCQCKSNTEMAKLPCHPDSCEQKPSFRMVCIEEQLFNVAIVYSKDEEGKCVPKEQRHRVETPRCKGHLNQRFTRCINGKKVLIERRLQNRNCRCRTKLKKRVLGPCYEDCESKNHDQPPQTRQKCDPETNQIITLSLKWALRDGNCVRQWVATDKRAEPDCPAPSTRRQPCDPHTGKQKLEHLEYQMVNCRCVGPKKTASFKKCSCQGPKVLGRNCDARNGRIALRMLVHQWNFELDRCHSRLVRKFIPIPCPHHSQYKHGPCRKGRMELQQILFVRNRKDCRCLKKVQKKKINCNCPVVVHRGKCTEGHLMAVTKIFHRKFDLKKRRCVVVDEKRQHRRCYCPKPRINKKCKDGKILISSLTHRLVNGECVADKSEETVLVACKKPDVVRNTECDPDTCHRKILRFQSVVDRKTCRCKLQLVNTQFCRCCGCPVHSVETKCINDDTWRISTTVHSLRLKICSRTCSKHVTHRTKRIRCLERRQIHWTSCQRCKSRMVIEKYQLVNCRCQRFTERTNKFRDCCCTAPTKLRTWCQQSTGLFITQEKRQVLSAYRCVWVTTITSSPKPDCQLPVTPIIYGQCDNTTCLQSITHVRNVLNKQNCSCIIQQVPAGNRPCCCLDTKVNVTEVCIGDSTKRRTTVVPTFDESTHTCRSFTIINETTITCGTGETRSSDPPCIGQTRSIETTRLTPINCQCQNQTISTRTEKCFCNPPQNLSLTCDGKGHLVQEQLIETLVNGECVRSTNKVKIWVTCDNTVRKDTVCNNQTCLETVTSRQLRLDKTTCTCVERATLTNQLCCCPTTVETRSECVENQSLTINTRQELEATTRTCVPRNTTTRAGDVPCALETREDKGCDLSTRNRTIIIIRRAIINCFCQVVSTTVVQQICACPPARTYQHKCNRTTCQRLTVNIQYNPVTDQNGNVTCPQIISKTFNPCCCTPLGQKRVQVRIECDRETGSFQVSKHWKEFIPTTGQCVDRYKSWIKNVDCSGKFGGEDKLVNRGPCNFKTGLRTLTVKWYVLDTQSCSCKLHVKKYHKVCSCKHKPIRRHESCNLETNEIVYTRQFFVLQEGTCVPKEETHRQQVACPENKKMKELCHNCNNIVKTTFNVLSHCKCKPKKIIDKTKCCCPETQFHRTCHNNRIKLTTIRYNLSVDKKSCERVEDHRFKRLSCQKPRLIKRKCNPTTCFAHTQEEKFHLKRCKCVRKVTVHKRRCCCPKAKLRTLCHKDSLVHERTEYHLRNGQCVAQVSRKRNRVRCHESKMVGKTSCNPVTGQRFVNFKSFVVHKCKCVPKHKRHTELCACPKSRIVRQLCTKKLRERKVIQIDYRRVHGKCRPHNKLLFKEPCHCPNPKRKKVCDLSGRVLLLKELSYQLTTRYGRRACDHSEGQKPQKIHCPKQLVKPEPCHNGRRKIFITQYFVHHCRCVQKVKVKHLKCVVRLRRRRSVRKCHKGTLIEVTVITDPETGMKREQRHVKEIVCDERPRVVPLTKKCVRRGKDHGTYRKVAIIRSVREGCECKQTRQVRWRLCRCEGVKKGHRCVHNVIEQRYLEENEHIDGHCRHKRVRHTKEHRCPKKPVTVNKSPCDKHTCTKRVLVTRCWMEHCQCKCRKQIGKEICCTKRPVNKQFCKNNQIHYISTKFQLKKRKCLAKDSETGEDWNEIDIKPSTKHSTKQINCPKPEVRQFCHKETGVLTKRITVFQIVNCKCKPRMRSVHTRCRCPPPSTRAGPCINGRRKMTTVSYYIGRDERCDKKLSNGWKPCACPKPTQSVKCVSGLLKICTLGFKHDGHSCRPTRRCRTKTINCPAPNQKRGRCSRKTNKLEIIFFRFSVNHHTCKCDRNVVIRHEYCSCKHLNKKHHSCQGNVWVNMKINFKLVHGECLPDESVSHTATVCPGERTEIVPHTCERRSGLSSSGTQISRTITSVAHKCKCKNKIRTARVPCICSLIPEFATTQLTVCKANNQLITKVTSFHLVDGKCEPRTEKHTKLVKCYGTKKIKTACLKDDLGDSFQFELTLYKKPRLCQCQWVLVKKIRINCGCRPPSSETVCVGDEILQKSVISFSRPTQLGANCEPQTEITNMKVNCSEPRTILQPCNTKTCFAKEITFSFKPKHCMCHPVTSYRAILCCCPPAIVSPEQCNPQTNQYEQVTTRYDLVNGSCAMSQNTTYRSVICDTRAGETNTSACNSTTNRQTFSTRDVAIVNCQCTSTVRSVTQPCGCPTTVRIERGLCNGTQNFTTDNYYRQVLNTNTSKCDEVLYNSVQRPCLCNGVYVSILCVGANGNIRRRVTYFEQLVNNTCVNNTIVNDAEVTCPNNQTSSQQTRSDCDPVTNTRSVSLVNFFVSNCTCVSQTSRSGEPCNCFSRNGGRIETKICREDNVTVTNITQYYDGPGGVCVPSTIIKQQVISCNGTKEDRDECNEDTGKVEIRVYKLVQFRCSCKWIEQPTRYEDCICKPPHTNRICENNKHLYVTKYFELVDGQCQEREHKRYDKISCEEDGGKSGVHYEKCEGGTRGVVTYVHRLHDCKCVTKIVRNQCPCICPNSRTWSACKDNQIVKFELSYSLIGCRCVKKLRVRENGAICAKQRVERSACIRGSNGDGYMTVVTSNPRSVNCRCQDEKREEQIACECQPLEHVQRQCKGRLLTLVTSRRQLVNGCCVRVIVKTETQSVACPLQTVKTVSECDERGYRELERTVWKAVDCQCVPQVRLEKQHCSKKCDMAPRLVKTSPCEKGSCTQRMYYYYNNEKCQSQYFVITAKCCCPPSRPTDKKCLGTAFELRDVFFKLEKGECGMSSVVYRQEIECQRNENLETVTSANGNIIVLKTWHAVKNCLCKKFTAPQQVKGRECRSPEVEKKCISEPEPRTVQTIVRYVKLTEHEGCDRVEDVVEKPVICPLAIVHHGPCHKDIQRNAYVRKVTQITFEKVNCQCDRKVTHHYEVCRCFQSSVTNKCHKRKGVLIVTRRHYEVSPEGDTCHERSDTQMVQVNCDEIWRAPRYEDLPEDGDQEGQHHAKDNRRRRKRRDVSENESHDGAVDQEDAADGRFSKYLEREVRVGCSCRLQRRQRSCDSSCPETSTLLVCYDGNKLFKVVTSYRPCGPCQCSYHVKKEPVPIHVPETRTELHECVQCKQKVEKIEYRVENCKVKVSRHFTKRLCCCSKPPRTHLICRASQLQIRQVETDRLTKDGQCVPQYKNFYMLIRCRRIIKETALNKCIDGKRVWRRESERLDKCRCKRQFEHITRSCGFIACESSIVRFGPCINCASKETKIEFLYNAILKRCEAKQFHKVRNCCCPPPTTTEKCIGNRLLLITTSYKFNIKTGDCVKSEKSKDITKRAYLKCKEKRRTTIGPCLENGFQLIVTRQPTLIDCACQLSQSIRLVRCRCEPPSVTESCINGTIKYSKTIRQELAGTTCKNITDETFAQVECPFPSTSEGICDTSTCRRTITDVSYSVSDCACQKLTTQRLEICCCPQAVQETRTCQRADNTQTILQQYHDFDIQNRACVTRTRTERVGTLCPQNYVSTSSACDQFRNNSMYRTITESMDVPSGCDCVRQTTTRTELCGCDASQEFTVCTPENQLLTYRIEYRPDANNTICLPNRVDLSLRDVVCDGTQRSDTPSCAIGTRSAAGETRITVVTSWMTRSGNCTCGMQTRSEQVLCACPEPSQPKTICDSQNHQEVNVTTVYTLQVTGSIRQCIPSKVLFRLNVTRCNAAVVQLGQCQFGLMSVNTLVHHLHACSCVPKVYKHQQRCHKVLLPCINKLPDWYCQELDRNHNICSRNFTNVTADSDPELREIAELSSLCDRECRRCDDCHSIAGQWQFKYADRECLVTNVRYPSLSIRNEAGFLNCLAQCKADLNCRSFDFYLPSGQCTLASVDRHSLHDLLLPRHHIVGALPSDNQHRSATRCNLYERVCNKRITTRLEEVQLGCPGRQITHRDSHCKCQPVSLGQGAYPYCYRTVTVVYYARDPSGKCQPKTTYLRLPCRFCRDKLPPLKCKALDALGGCSVGFSASLCAQTCRLCQCDGREFVNPGVCNVKTGKREEVTVRTELVRGFQLCHVIVQKVAKLCQPCIVGLSIQPQPCIGNHRVILYINTFLVNGQCVQTIKRVIQYCEGCFIGVRTSLGPCANGLRSVNSFFAVKDGPGKPCKEEKVSYEVGCKDCPPTVVKSQPCIDGRQLRQVRYFVRPKGSETCLEARFETQDKCGMLCRDQITDPECAYQHSSGQCEWNLITRTVCSSTCKRCC